MLVTICCAAVCLQLPYTVLYLLNADKYSLWPGEHEHRALHARIYLYTKIAEMFETLNHAVNFFLYCASGWWFRYSVLKLCRRQQRLQRLGGRYEHVQIGTVTVTCNLRRPKPNKSAATRSTVAQRQTVLDEPDGESLKESKPSS